MADAENDPLREGLETWIGKSLGPDGPTLAPDPVNLPMIRHWVDAFDDQNPIYLDEEVAATHGRQGIVAPPAMLQAWTMPRPRIEGIAERGGSPTEIQADNPISVLAEAGFTGTLATNSELDFERDLHPGDHLQSSTVLESISQRKTTALGQGYFITWITTYADTEGAVVGRQLFRILKFAPALPGAGS